MAKIKSSIEVAKEAVSGFDRIEKPNFKKVHLGESNLPAMKNAVELMDIMDTAINDLIDVSKKQAKKIVDLANKKEQDDKNDAQLFLQQ